MQDIITPIPGTFYRKPSPDSPAYVEVGSSVEEDTTVALVEVMKNFNEIKAGVKGVVKEILVENEEFVNAGTVLMRVE